MVMGVSPWTALQYLFQVLLMAMRLVAARAAIHGLVVLAERRDKSPRHIVRTLGVFPITGECG